MVQMENFPYMEFEKYIKGYLVKPFPSNGFKVLYSQKNQESGILGAAYYAFRKLEARAL